MLNALWNFLLGYVIIRVEGNNLERFVNRALTDGIEIWNVKRCGARAMTAQVKLESFYNLRPIVRSLGCRVHIIGKHGAAFSITKMRFRKVLLFGWIAVIAALGILSRFVWIIEVEGCDAVTEAEVRQMLGNIGIKTGIVRTEIATGEVGGRLSQLDKRIAWAGASVDGVVLRVSITESSENSDIVPYTDGPRNIVAKKDGVILHIVALKGDGVVNEGDAVKAGDLLITGDLSSDDVGMYVGAAGTVEARVPYTFSVTVGPVIPGTIKTGNMHECCKVSLEGLFELQSKPKYDLYSVEYGETVLLKNCFIPISIQKGVCYELMDGERRASEEEMREYALMLCEKMLDREIDKDAVILSRQSQYSMLEDGSVRLILSVTTRESIVLYEPLDVTKEQSQNE